MLQSQNKDLTPGGGKWEAIDFSLCSPIPPHTPHAVSVSLPKWIDNVDYEEGNPRVTEKMKSGYPRFCVHASVKKLFESIVTKTGLQGYACFGFPSRRVANECIDFIRRQSPSAEPRLAEYNIKPKNEAIPPSTLVAVLVPQELYPLAKAFWQHTGEIITSRYAEYHLASDGLYTKPPRVSTRYSKNVAVETTRDAEPDSYLEDRYGRNLGIEWAGKAKLALRRRVAASLQDAAGLADISNVYLYPTGMSAIYNAHRLALGILGNFKSVCFGFPYTDTLKILQKFGPGCHFLGSGEDEDLERLERILEQEPILALFCEFPSNPLLKSPALGRIRQLADKYGFLVVVDETIGGLINLNVLEVADIAVSSLTKIFSGDSNVMGGSLVISPKSSKLTILKQWLKANYEDLMWCEDAIFLERNSRSFEERVRRINGDAEALCDFLRSHPLVKQVHYPKFTTLGNFEQYQRPNTGYGGLFSLDFHQLDHAITFYDNLPCAKGPSLGTNFTLACPYTLLAHYSELDWAANYGVSSSLVRVSVGLEGENWLIKAFSHALSCIINEIPDASL
ncbi:Cystathionine gamma-synthase [Entomophthora muscae]|uniref:Cystathionine gamma-synthase n=1 Tax=Entomophthora muscae TaxID=34485 RepID=A0ACC2U932_9FUNG|nr:Cystathionine gamma-synthase [Entomophthora muscae]